MEAKRYEISSVNDFLKVPEEKLDRCLEEFKTALVTHKVMTALFMSSIEALAGKEIDWNESAEITSMPKFTWIDDDKGNITVRISTAEDHGCEV